MRITKGNVKNQPTYLFLLDLIKNLRTLFIHNYFDLLNQSQYTTLKDVNDIPFDQRNFKILL